MSFYYLATPYSKYAGGLEAAFQAAAEQAALLVKAGVPVYSPIAHTHPVAIHGDIDPLDHSIWLEADRTFMEAARALIVCQLDGWEESYGIEQEIRYFQKADKPIFYMTPGIVPGAVKPVHRRIIGLCGFAGSGKDTAAQGLIDDGWTRVAFADGVREALLALNPLCYEDVGSFCHQPSCVNEVVAHHGWQRAKEMRDIRRLLQRMGTEAGRNIHGDDCWIKLAKRKIDAAPGNVVITDVRFANEAAAIRSWGGVVVRIERPGVGPANGHVSEQLDFSADHTIYNDGSISDLWQSMAAYAGEAVEC